MNPQMYRVQDRVYGLNAQGRRVLVATPGTEIPLEQAIELGLHHKSQTDKAPAEKPEEKKSVRPVSSATAKPKAKGKGKSKNTK